MVNQMRVLLLLTVALFAGCIATPDPDGQRAPTIVTQTVTATATVTPAEKPTISPQEAATFPTLRITEFGYVYHEEGDRTYFVILVHDSGPCIDPDDYVWEQIDLGSRARVVINGAYDGAVSSAALTEWCLHDDAGIDVGDWTPTQIVAYEKSSGREVFRGDVPALPEEAAATARSPQGSVLEITLVKRGENGPYQFTDASKLSFAKITVDGITCKPSSPGAVFPTTWGPGGVIRLTGNAGAGDCIGKVLGGRTVAVTVTVAGTVIVDTDVDIRM